MSSARHSVERRQITFESDTNKNFEKVFEALAAGELPKQGIFYNGQVYDAYTFCLRSHLKGRKIPCPDRQLY